MIETIIREQGDKKFYKDTFAKTTADRRKKVLDVAVGAFASNGYNATNINEIAKKAGVSIGAMYSYFASKEDLFLTIVDNAYAILESLIHDLTAHCGDLFDCIARMLKASREFAVKYPELNQIYLDLTTQALSSMSVRLSNKIEVITMQLYARIFEQAKREGKIRSDADAKVMAFCIDNLFVMYQFSFSSDYYKERMKIFVGEEKMKNIEEVDACILNFIRSALVGQSYS